jgi:hypothetical protein
MQTTERYEDWSNVIRQGNERGQSRLWTAMPVIVLKDSDGFTVECVVALKYVETDEFGNVEHKDISKLVDVPVCWPQGGGSEKGDKGYAMTFPIKKDDEGIVVFASRCIDSWHELGKKKSNSSQSQTQERTVGTPPAKTDVGQPLIHTRMHNLSDAMFIPGVRSKPRKMNPKPSTTAAQLRTDDQHLYCEISQEKAKLVFATDKQGSSSGGSQGGQQQEKETQPRMVVEVYQDKIRGYVLDDQGRETSYFEHTKDGAFNGKAPQGVTWDAPFIRCTGEVTAKYDGGKVSLSTHTHSQPNDSKGDSEQETRSPTAGT